MLCYSTGSLPNRPFKELCKIIKPSIFTGIELVILPEFLNQSSDFWKQTLHIFQENDLTIRNIHLGHLLLLNKQIYYPSICEENKTQREIKWNIILQCLKIAELLNAPHLTITSGIVNSNIPLQNQINLYYDFFEWLFSNYQGSVQLGVEQEPEHIIHSSSQLLELCQKFQGKIGANFDIGHSHVLGENISEMLNKLAPYIYNLHLEDIQDRTHKHLLFGEGNIPFDKIQNQLSQMCYQGDYTPDLYPFNQEYQKAIKSSEIFFKTFI